MVLSLYLNLKKKDGIATVKNGRNIMELTVDQIYYQDFKKTRFSEINI